MRHAHRLLRSIPLLLAAALAACDQRASDTPAAAPGAGPAPLLSAGAEAIPGRYVVVLHDQPGAAAHPAAEMVAAYGGTLRHAYAAALNGFAADLSPQAVEALRRNPRVKYVAEDAMVYLDVDTTQTGATWGLDRVDQRNLPLSTTYVYGRNGAGVRAYVIDTGIRTSHAEFGGRASVGTDLVGDGQNGQDCNGHGTHVAGTIAGATYGVAKAAQVVSVRVFGCTGGASYSTVIAAVDWVTANGVKPAVVNMSLGGSVYAPVNQAVQNSIAAGFVYAVAAGNENIDACGRSPASTPEAITVGSTTSNDLRSSFSNWGTCVDLFAPGSSITSAWWNSDTAIGTISGTSMATPHAAGVAALYLQGNPTATPAAVAAELSSTSTLGRLTDVGTGSPNKLLFSRLTAEAPGPMIVLNPGALTFTFVRTVAGATAEAPAAAATQAFAAAGDGEPRVEPAGWGAGHAATATSTSLSSRVVLSNTGTAGLNWNAASNRPWLAVDPANGRLTEANSTYLNATVNAAGLAAGTHTGAVAVADPAAVNSPGTVNVTVNVTEALALVPGTPRTPLSGAGGSQAFYAVNVPAGATSLTIRITGGTGDADLYVRYGNVPTLNAYDCRPYIGGNVETCQAVNPLPGTYYVMLHGFASYSGVTLSAEAGGPPVAPVGLTSRPASTSAIRLAWTDSSVNETSFAISRRSQSGGTWSGWAEVATAAANATSFTNTGLSAGTPYQYRIRACNAAGCSAWRESPTLTIPTELPAAPFALAAAVVSGTRVNLTWTDGSTNEGSFTLTRALRNPDGTWGAYANVASPVANATTWPSTALTPGDTYRFQLRACNVVGCSGWATSNIVTLPTVPVAPPSITASVLSGTTIRVQWADSSTNETSFTLARAPVSGAGVVGAFADIATLAPNQVRYDNGGRTPGTYQYRVRACNLAGCSAWTTSASVTIPPVPAAPTGLEGTALSPTSIRVTWTDASPVETSYQVSRALLGLDGVWSAQAVIATLPANTALYDNTGLLSGRSYRYQVRACNLSGCSAPVATRIVTTP